jgi:hypothetical protein
MADADGKYSFKIEVIHLETEKPVAMIVIPHFNLEDRLNAVELALRVPPMRFEAPGKYEFQLLANDVWIGRTTLFEKKEEKQ